MTKEEINKLKIIAENDDDDFATANAMAQLRAINPTYHWCHEWDLMVICNEDPEFDACTCGFPKKKSKK